MLLKTSTKPGYPPTAGGIRSWQGYLSKLVALVALLGALGASQGAWGQTYNYSDVYVTATPNGTSSSNSTVYNGLYSTDDNNATADFDQTDLGNGSMFDQSTGSLMITQATDNLSTSSSKPYKSSTFLYRVYLSGATTIPDYTQVSLNQTSSSNAGSGVTFGSGTVSIDLLNQSTVLGGGTYIVEIRFSSTYSTPTRSNPNGTGVVEDPSTSAGYQANFTVRAPAVTPPGGMTTWQGTIDADWTKAGNWTNGVPTKSANAIIQERTNGSKIIYPVLNDSTIRYEVNNLTLNGDLSSTKSLLIVQKAALYVYGDIRQDAGGLVGTVTGSPRIHVAGSNSTLILAGTNQVVTGDLQMSDVVAAGSGTKSVTGNLIVTNTLSFEPADAAKGVLIQTAVERTVNGKTTVNFTTTSGHTVDLRASGFVYAPEGETTTSYVNGVLLANRTLVNGTNQPFGNIGIELQPNHNSDASVFVRRVVGDPLFGPTSSNSGGTPVPIKRQYEITKDDDSRSANQSSSASNVIFHYLPSADELNGIKQQNLTYFRTENNGVPYTALGGTPDTTNHVVTLAGLPSLDNYTLTLGDKTNPLPVSLVAFGATRSGANAQLIWVTASEENNSGFKVQVSADGTAFRTLAFVASQSPNSSSNLTYKYADTEAGKTGTRYYRLEQVDENGKSTFSPVRVLSFDGATTGTGALVAYPNPFGDAVSLSVDGVSMADGVAYVKVVDMTGRTVRDEKLSLVGSSLTLGNLSDLRSGLYLAKVTLPDGTTQTVRISKQ